MDVLSDAIATMRTGVPVLNRARLGRGGWRFAPYDGTGFHIVLDGRCWLLPDSGEPVALGVGDVVLLARGQGHALAFGDTEAPSRRQTLLFDEWNSERVRREPAASDATTAVLCGKYRRDGSRPHPLLRELPDVLRVPSGMGRHVELRCAVDLLAREAGAPRTGGQSLVASLLDVVFVYLLRAWLDDCPAAAAGAGWRRALTDPVCTVALDAMHGDPAFPWTLEGLSRLAGVSRATLSRRFTALAGQSPMAYLTWWRMATAARLLNASDAPLTEIASRAGYGSAFAFSHAFKREFGQAPNRYRREARLG
ncbi:AraC family transcriptional regulator [Streptomyces sp. SL13]|uniref:AraC family transcriptional regulator n=1 Tax=Streptantibioticus silvisoli TaxID=2705255 RepID=A0AA90KJR1_9ACTN|nr:AraC family transcriptional regulator [Streptantibioticus silvisoli]MDI5973769.1 AraC family transcriptional regulator [Streptantibioticus silvisoli]